MSRIADDLLAKIDKHGFTFIGVMSDGRQPGFTYSVGLTAIGMPELIMFAVPMHYAVQMMSELIEKHRQAGTVPMQTTRAEPLMDYSNLPGHLIIADPDRAERFTYQAKYYAEDLGLTPHYLQWVFPDREGNFPWDEHWDTQFNRAQPLLGEMLK
ncbi:MAG: DUF4262 domain-containing protein [Pseudomonas sp.]